MRPKLAVAALALLAAPSASGVDLAPGDVVAGLTGPGVYRIDPVSGAIEMITRDSLVGDCLVPGVPHACCTGFDTGDGTGVCVQTGSGPAFGVLERVYAESASSILVTTALTDTLIRVDPSTGDRTVIASPSVGTGAAFGNGGDIEVQSDGQILIQARTPLNHVLRIDPVSLNRVIVSGSGVGTGPGLSGSPGDLGLETVGTMLTVAPSAQGPLVLRIDPVTGDRTTVSGGGVGSGPAFQQLSQASLTLEKNGGILIADSTLRAILRVDPVTGDRSVVASDAVGSGPAMTGFVVWEMAVEADRSILVQAATPDREVIRIDPDTGDRSVLTSYAGLLPTVGGVETGLHVVPAGPPEIPGLGPLPTALVAFLLLGAMLLASARSGLRRA